VTKELAVAIATGAIFGLAKAAAKDFDPAVAGSYRAIYYAKTNSFGHADRGGGYVLSVRHFG
jgi:hypothetical protein